MHQILERCRQAANSTIEGKSVNLLGKKDCAHGLFGRKQGPPYPALRCNLPPRFRTISITGSKIFKCTVVGYSADAPLYTANLSPSLDTFMCNKDAAKFLTKKR